MTSVGGSTSHLRIRKRGLTREHLACALIQTASRELFERGQQDAHTKCLVVAVERVWRPR